MKRMTILVLMVAVVLSMVTYAVAEGTLRINGVNIPMIGSDGEELFTKEIDGTIYIPVEPFLKALGMDYAINDDSVNVTYVASADSHNDEYENLLPEEKYFVDLVLDKATSFKNPSTITVKSLFYMGDESIESKIYLANISAQNGFGGYTSQYYMIMTDGSFTFWHETEAENAAELLATGEGIEQPNFDYGRINRAIQQKVSELGY